uniref:Bm12827 n=1 Tax=Brugia malayi TaxID=6279 RepID=A0A1I9G600_BRUMA|nr:Bm12827 [Brugia malayi]
MKSDQIECSDISSSPPSVAIDQKDWSGTCTTGIRAVHYHAIEELLRGKARAAAGAFPVFISLWVVASSAGVADFPLDG